MIQTYAYGQSKYLLSEKQEIKWSNIIKRYKKMINFDDVIKEKKKNIIHTGYKFLIIHTEY